MEVRKEVQASITITTVRYTQASAKDYNSCLLSSLLLVKADLVCVSTGRKPRALRTSPAAFRPDKADISMAEAADSIGAV